MNKIIAGRRYDTESAREVGHVSADFSTSDFSYWEETLFQKRTGEYFLFGEGGPMSRYAKSSGYNEWGWGEKIIPLSIEGAQKWAEKNLTANQYEKIFGEIEETEEKKIVTYSLTVAAIEKITRLAAEKGISKSELIEQLIAGKE